MVVGLAWARAVLDADVLAGDDRAEETVCHCALLGHQAFERAMGESQKDIDRLLWEQRCLVGRRRLLAQNGGPSEAVDRIETLLYEMGRDITSVVARRNALRDYYRASPPE